MRGQHVVEQFEKGGLTTVSLSDDAPSSDRRMQPRHVTVLRVAKLITPHGEELCLVRDISAGGLMAHIYSELKVGDPVTAEFKSGHVAPGTISWRREGLAGITFDGPVDAERILSGDDAAPNSYQARSPRLGIKLRARVRVGGFYRAASLCDISQGGAKIQPPDLGEIGQAVVLAVTGLPAIAGVIRWRDSDYAGIQFDIAVPFRLLAEWAATVQHRADPDDSTISITDTEAR
jgi:hypothetical protein